ncbi:hypothetical protein V2J09_005839 [Rumex salicifolius]
MDQALHEALPWSVEPPKPNKAPLAMDQALLQYIHRKTLTETDVNVRLAFPVRLIDLVWDPEDGREKAFHVVDRFGTEWKLGYHMRWDQHGHRKPEVYGSDWKYFVRMNRLRAHDQIFFYHHPAPAANHLSFVCGGVKVPDNMLDALPATLIGTMH